MLLEFSMLSKLGKQDKLLLSSVEERILNGKVSWSRINNS